MEIRIRRRRGKHGDVPQVRELIGHRKDVKMERKSVEFTISVCQCVWVWREENGH